MRAGVKGNFVSVWYELLYPSFREMINAFDFWVFVRAENPVKDNLVQFRVTITDKPAFFLLVFEILS
jgi:hypothetical protein